MRLIFLMVVWLFAGISIAEEQAGKAQAIAAAIDVQLHDFKDQQAGLKMVLVDAAGREAVRRMQVKSLALAEEERTLMVFDEPLDVAGTALLSYAMKKGSNEQWLYLPAIKRVKRISTKTMSGPFMGSEFAYEDIITPFMEQFDYQYEGQQACGELTCDVLWRIPKDPYSGYSKEKLLADTELHLIRQIDYFDRKGSLLKTYTASDFKNYNDTYWRPLNMLMVNHQSQKQTRLSWENFEFDQGLTAGAFTQNALKRAR